MFQWLVESCILKQWKSVGIFFPVIINSTSTLSQLQTSYLNLFYIEMVIPSDIHNIFLSVNCIKKVLKPSATQ